MWLKLVVCALFWLIEFLIGIYQYVYSEVHNQFHVKDTVLANEEYLWNETEIGVHCFGNHVKCIYVDYSVI